MQKPRSLSDIITESGRSVVASHSILVTDVCDRTSIDKPSRGNEHEPIIESFISILEMITVRLH